MYKGEKLGTFIVPTGIGASIGGFAGDASFWSREFSKKSKLIVNPNVVNAACFSGINENMLYVEGYTLDDFFKGNVSLKTSLNNKIGIVFDKSISQEVLNIHINTINAVKTVYGIDVIGYEVAEKEVGVEFYKDKLSKISVGNIKNLDTLFNSVEKLINSGADAIAIVCHFPDEDDGEDDYSNGIGVDPVGGAEAIISHYVSKMFKVPCAHAPAFSDYSISTKIVDSRCSAEYITPTFLPCILIGLAQAPLISDYDKDLICVDNADYIVVPYNSVGCIPVLEAVKRNIPVYAIKENRTTIDVIPEKFCEKCVIINTYKELLELI